MSRWDGLQRIHVIAIRHVHCPPMRAAHRASLAPPPLPQLFYAEARVRGFQTTYVLAIHSGERREEVDHVATS